MSAALLDWVLAEDIGTGDCSARLLPETQRGAAKVIVREPGVLAGRIWAQELWSHLDESVNLQWWVEDGDRLEPDQPICHLEGRMRSLLTGERAMLNILQFLSGTATTTAQYVKALEGLSTQVLDTRKTLPVWREAQKQAVRCGGGHNHRSGLYDAILIKENHIKACGSIEAAWQRAQAVKNDHLHLQFIAIEVETLDELNEAVGVGFKRILLDNFSLETLGQAMNALVDHPDVFVEASGNITLDNVREVAMTGVHAISIGALTKHVRALDLSMQMLE